MVDLGSFTSDLRGGSSKGVSREERQKIISEQEKGIVRVGGTPDRPQTVRVSVSGGGTQAPPPQRVTEQRITTPSKQEIKTEVIQDRVLTPSQKLQVRRETQQQRIESGIERRLEEERITSLRSKGTKKKVSDLKVFGLGFAKRGVETAKAFSPQQATIGGRIKTVTNLIEDPTGITKGVSQSLGTTGTRLKTDTVAMSGGVAFDIAASIGLAPGEALINKVGGRLSPKFVGSTKVGQTIKAGTSDLKIVSGVSSTKEPLARQVQRAGTTQSPTSAAQDFFKTNKPGEIVVIKKSVPQGTAAIEKQFFADPTTRVRTSRLQTGSTPLEKTFADEISLQLGTKEQQIIIFKDQPIASFPTELRPAISNIRSGKSLTKSQVQKLLEFQTTGEPGVFKAPGKPTVESEVTLLEGSAVESKGLVARTEVKGTPIKIFEARAIKAPQVSKSLATAKSAGLTTSSFDISRTLTSKAKIPVTTAAPITRSNIKISRTSTPILRASKPVIRQSRQSTINQQNNIIRGSSNIKTVQRLSTSSQTFQSGSRGKSPFSLEPRRTTQQKQSFQPSNIIRPSQPQRQNNIIRLGRPQTTTVHTKPSLIPTSFSSRKEPSRSFFTVQVLDKGVFRTVGRARQKERAFSIGISVVGSSALRTVRVLKNGEAVAIKNKRFRRSKSRAGAFVEKSQFAINTPGELFEIPGARRGSYK